MVPRLDADALVDALALHVPAGRVPVRRGSSSENAAAAGDEPEFELLDTGVFDDGRYWEITADYAKAAPDDIFIRVSVRNAGPRARRRSTSCRRSGSATPGRGASTPRSRRSALDRTARSSPSTTSSARAYLVGQPARRGALLRERDERRAALRRRRPRRRTRRTGSTTTSSTARRRSTPTRPGTKAAFRYRLEVAAGETVDDPAAARAETARPSASDFDGDAWPPASARPTSSTPS